MQELTTALEAYKVANNVYPTTAQGLALLGPNFPNKDPWGNNYAYTSPGDHGV